MSRVMSELYQAIDVWKRLSDGRLVRYRCFRDISSGRYSVQSSDFYSVPTDPEHIASLEAQYLELLAEQSPSARSGAFDTVEDAIDDHEREFSSRDDGGFTA